MPISFRLQAAALGPYLLLASGVAQTTTPRVGPPVSLKGSQASAQTAETTITAANLLAHIQELSSDAYTGRHPGTPGETRSVAYLIAQAKALGLQPGNPDGSWTETVKLWGMLSQGSEISITYGDKVIPLVAGTDYTAWSAQPQATVTLQPTEVVFAGYGVVAPEYGWDDYSGVDVRGKTVLILSGDPPVADPGDPAMLDDKIFLGKALTVHGRTGTKFDQAFRHGAAAAILVSATPEASPFLLANYTREIMTLRGPGERDRVQAQALLSLNAATALVNGSGASFDSLRAAAARRGFRAVPLAAQASFKIQSRVREVDSSNVIARLPGSDPKLRGEYVVYSAHWDHHGEVGTQIFHGASDNAAGAAGILELARAFRTLSPAPRRTLLFLWPTAEEKGLLGARWYVEHPLYPLAKTVADINLDYFSNWGWGRTHDFSIVGLGNSTLDDLATAAVVAQGRRVTPDTLPEQGFYFRSDHYEFARAGVPSIETAPGIDYVDKPAAYGVIKRSEYIGSDYHQPSDVIKPAWNLSGAVEDLQVLYQVGLQAAQSDTRPTWKPGAIWRPKP